jgi:hypothetical protein
MPAAIGVERVPPEGLNDSVRREQRLKTRGSRAGRAGVIQDRRATNRCELRDKLIDGDPFHRGLRLYE